ncbi:hypothetical protein [Neptunicella sp. SCSIO 80796]|uniref:hypothetical protein n=1 Tax=Neptunicella plasticusilytica TaxID=3117012 RepID=UPI003A4D5E9D
MEISATSNIINSTISRPNNGSEQKTNAYGIGSANQHAVELSPQARILQQNEQQQKLQQNSSDEDPKQKDQPGIGRDFVRVSSSIGKGTQSNALTAEQALDVYRSIEQLL